MGAVNSYDKKELLWLEAQENLDRVDCVFVNHFHAGSKWVKKQKHPFSSQKKDNRLPSPDQKHDSLPSPAKPTIKEKFIALSQ